MSLLNKVIGGVMILLGLFILFMASQMIIHAFRGISGIIQGGLVVAIGAALCYFGYRRATRE